MNETAINPIAEWAQRKSCNETSVTANAHLTVTGIHFHVVATATAIRRMHCKQPSCAILKMPRKSLKRLLTMVIWAMRELVT